LSESLTAQGAELLGALALAWVIGFQRAQGWTGRGNVGPKTWGRLF